MQEYTLYLESGPKQRKTMVHALDLLGCVVRGATTQEALAATPAGIRACLRFLQANGEPVDSSIPIHHAYCRACHAGHMAGRR